jgi:hypothetical protein
MSATTFLLSSVVRQPAPVGLLLMQAGPGQEVSDRGPDLDQLQHARLPLQEHGSVLSRRTPEADVRKVR